MRQIERGGEEERAEREKYKELLGKQRDIMIALTSRLNERDERIRRMEEDIEAEERCHEVMARRIQ